MTFNFFAIIALFMAAFMVKVVRDLVRNRDSVFDEQFTETDRTLVTQAAFLLVAVSVALHELGHATLVWLFGGQVTGFGYYVFAGYVSYQGALTDVQQILVASAGVTVNVLLGALAVAVVFLKRPPMRAAFNELLLQFTFISVANALIFYPLIDLFSNLNGDFRQMYFGGVPWLSAIIFAIHASLLIGIYLASKSDRVGARLAELTGLPPHVRRGFLGGMRLATNRRPNSASDGATAAPALSPEEAILRNVAGRIASGWPAPIEAIIHRRADGPALIVRWRNPDGMRAVTIAQEPAGSVVIMILQASGVPPTSSSSGRVWQRWAGFPSEDELVLGLRIAMEQADRHDAIISVATAPGLS